ncbi:unnamed protein product [Orchesella dallaii]|uniref:Uncharacterized protein n=1 Tax=Orchesella dallaii TaxID=48710 RepID=A0ABP1RZB7_9HEXA
MDNMHAAANDKPHHVHMCISTFRKYNTSKASNPKIVMPHHSKKTMVKSETFDLRFLSIEAVFEMQSVGCIRIIPNIIMGRELSFCFFCHRFPFLCYTVLHFHSTTVE